MRGLTKYRSLLPIEGFPYSSFLHTTYTLAQLYLSSIKIIQVSKLMK